MMSLWDALRMNMMISYQELVRTFQSSKAGVGVPIQCSVSYGLVNKLPIIKFLSANRDAIRRKFLPSLQTSFPHAGCTF
ncbi:hypothetical protein BUE65_20600 [Klebsiella variicola]|nr:hypothetical protein [Klebsiella pneumoniae]OWW14113.1 hypothetical protein BUE65_20600 [Klebsiella variicola]